MIDCGLLNLQALVRTYITSYSTAEAHKKKRLSSRALMRERSIGYSTMDADLGYCLTGEAKCFPISQFITRLNPAAIRSFHPFRSLNHRPPPPIFRLRSVQCSGSFVLQHWYAITTYCGPSIFSYLQWFQFPRTQIFFHLVWYDPPNKKIKVKISKDFLKKAP